MKVFVSIAVFLVIITSCKPEIISASDADIGADVAMDIADFASDLDAVDAVTVDAISDSYQCVASDAEVECHDQ